MEVLFNSGIDIATVEGEPQLRYQSQTIIHINYTSIVKHATTLGGGFPTCQRST